MSAKRLMAVMAHVMRNRTQGGVIKGVFLEGSFRGVRKLANSRVAWTKPMAVLREPENQDHHYGQNSSTAFTEKRLNSLPSCSEVGVEKSNDIVQRLGKFAIQEEKP
ncbi:uncharacterized protein LOC122281700 [Carya illinoinensis]|uniref:uncharacterized protein LOC122281700 n=1 Tax=Carya illinoinensis TaxID=32201 RepID=UPI001C71AC67|nr:uncharacterized protein LOC122281700 [Carya illinoinensis]